MEQTLNSEDNNSKRNLIETISKPKDTSRKNILIIKI